MTRFACVALVDPRGRVLMQERDEHALISPEKWGLPGGHVEQDEADEAAAYRELAEETGLRLESGLELFGEYQVFHAHTGTHDPFTLWVAATDAGDDDVECHEGRQMVFVDGAAVLGLDLTESAALALPELLGSDLYERLSA